MKLEYHLDSTLDLENKTITIELRKATEKLSKWVIDTRESAIRDALIKLGWIPPSTPPAAEQEPQKAGLHEKSEG